MLLATPIRKDGKKYYWNYTDEPLEACVWVNHGEYKSFITFTIGHVGFGEAASTKTVSQPKQVIAGNAK